MCALASAFRRRIRRINNMMTPLRSATCGSGIHTPSARDETAGDNAPEAVVRNNDTRPGLHGAICEPVGRQTSCPYRRPYQSCAMDYATTVPKPRAETENVEWTNAMA